MWLIIVSSTSKKILIASITHISSVPLLSPIEELRNLIIL